MRDYLPRHQGELLAWAETFASRIESAPQEYGLNIETAQEVAAAVEVYAQISVIGG